MKKEEKQMILDLFFIQRKKQIEIANILSISKFIVSRTVTKDSRYKKEKERRKKENQEKHKQKTNQYIAQVREVKRRNDYEIMKKIHEQASKELSEVRANISNTEFRKWNSSIYRYEDSLKCYILKNDIVTSIDSPKKISI